MSPQPGMRADAFTRTIVDVRAIGGVLALLAVVEAEARAAAAGASSQLLIVLGLLALATAAPLTFLRSGGALVAVASACLVSAVPFHSLTIAGAVAQVVAVYAFAGRDPRLVALVLVPFVVVTLTDPGHGERRLLALLLACLTPAAAWLAAAHQLRDTVRAHSAAQDQIAGTSFEHAVRGERARIVRELHDVVAHHVSMIAVQAETARLTTPGLPVAGAQRLSAIGDTARGALTEMRRLLGVLREDVEPSDVASRRPQPGLGQLNELLDAAREASGAGIRLIVQGSPISFDPGVELAAFRIAQEALTNTRRHAPGAAVDVELRYTTEALTVRVRDNGPGPPAELERIGAHGLLGMRERAVAVGGRLRYGPAAGGGFLVEATLPAGVDVTP